MTVPGDENMNHLFRTIAATLTLFLASAGVAYAIPITINMTADNIVNNGGLCFDATCTGGSNWSTLGGVANADDWQQSGTVVLDLDAGTHWFAWNVTNLGDAGSGNPAALLAEILWDGGANYSSSAWEHFNVSTGATIAGATEYGSNGGANIWTTTNGGPVAGISTSANWIYTANNFANADPEAWFRTSITVVPEPSTLTLLGASLLGFALFRRRQHS